MSTTTRITRRQGLLGLFGGSPGPQGLRHRAAGLVPAEPTARDRAGSAVRDHRAREPAVPDPQRVEQRRSAELQRARDLRGDVDRPPDADLDGAGAGDAGRARPYGAALPWADPSVMSPTDVAMGVATPATGQLLLGGAGADRVLPPPHRHDRPRRPAEGDEAAGRHERRRDGRLGLREAPVDLLRHGAGRADRGRRARQLERAGQLRGPHAALDLADAAQALLTGSRTDALVKARALRDQALNQLNQLAKDGREHHPEAVPGQAGHQPERRCARWRSSSARR